MKHISLIPISPLKNTFSTFLDLFPNAFQRRQKRDWELNPGCFLRLDRVWSIIYRCFEWNMVLGLIQEVADQHVHPISRNLLFLGNVKFIIAATTLYVLMSLWGPKVMASRREFHLKSTIQGTYSCPPSPKKKEKHTLFGSKNDIGRFYHLKLFSHLKIRTPFISIKVVQAS